MQNYSSVSPFNRQKKQPSTRRILLIAALGLMVVAAILFAYFLIKSQKLPPTSRNAVGKVIAFTELGYPGFREGSCYEAAFSDPFGVAVDSKGNIIIADAGESNRIRKITPDCIVKTIAGSDEGFADGPANSARFNTPSGIAIDEDDQIIIADTSNNRIRKLDANGQVTTIAGSGARGITDGAAQEATFDAPVGVAVDAKGNVYVADTYNDCIRKIAKDGQVSTLAGTGVAGYKDGQSSEAMFDTPCGIAVDKLGNVYIADTGNNAIRKITAQGEVTTIAKNSGEEASRETRLSQPVGLALTHDGFLFVSNQNNGRIQFITPEGEIKPFAGGGAGFADGTGEQARFNGASGIAINKHGNLFVADASNYLIRELFPVLPDAVSDNPNHAVEVLIQPLEANQTATTVASRPQFNNRIVPDLSKETLQVKAPFLWPVQPQNSWHEVAGVVGEVRGWFNGEARDHLHSGLDIAGKMGEPCLSIMDEKVSAPISNWGYKDTGEGLRVGLMSYIHIRIGRDSKDQIQVTEKFKPRFDETGKMSGVRVRRGTRFQTGDFIGTLNRLYHVHMNLGPRNGEANAIQFPFVNFKDTVAPVIEPNGIEVLSSSAQPFKEKANGRLKISGDVMVVVTAYDQLDGNNKTRKLGLYKVGYQLLNEDGTPAQGFEQPLVNIEFNRLPAGDEAVKIVYAEGSGVSAYGTPTKFKYIVTNRVRDGEARQGVLRASGFKPGNYLLKVLAEDYSGNRPSGKATELAITIQ